MINTLLLCTALLLSLYAALSINVSRMRFKLGKNPALGEFALKKAIRAHGNASEYIPLFIVIFLFLYLNSTESHRILEGVAVLATLSRFSHAIGMLLAQKKEGTNKPHPLHFSGALGTYICLFTFAGAFFLFAFNNAIG